MSQRADGALSWRLPARAELGARIEVLQAKVEDLDLGGARVDVLISEPMGTLLVNERMLETYLHARDHFLAPGGRMFPVRRHPHARLAVGLGARPDATPHPGRAKAAAPLCLRQHDTGSDW